MTHEDQQTPYPNALVWGAYGFMGRHLTARLLQLGGRVSILTRNASLYPPASWDSGAQAGLVTRFEVTASNHQEVFRRAAESAEVVFNLAGSNGAVRSNIEPRSSAEENSRVQAEFLSACARSDRHPHVVFTSSRLVYGRAQRLPVDEDHPLSPRSFYAANKLCCEGYHQAFAAGGAFTFTICRISNAFGVDPQFDRKDHGVINAFVEKALAGKPLTLFGGGSQLRDYIYIEDLIHALLLCGRHPAARDQIFNVGTGLGIRMSEAAAQIRQAAGGPPVESAAWPECYERVESGDYVSDIRKLHSRLGFSPSCSFEEGLADFVAQRRRAGARSPGGKRV